MKKIKNSWCNWIQCKINGKSIAGISENNLHLKEQRKNLCNLNNQKIYKIKFQKNWIINISQLNIYLNLIITQFLIKFIIIIYLY